MSAKLRLKVIDDSNDGGSVYLVSNDYLGTGTPWVETGLNYNNAPAITGSALSSLGTVILNQIVEFDVTSAIGGNGIHSFAIKNNSTDITKYSPKEGISAPELIVNINSTPNQSAKLSELQRNTNEVNKSEDTILPESINLSPNYPNPFNSETTIEYALPEDGQVRLKIFNIKGQEAVSLVDEKQTAGFKKVKWNGKNNSGKEISSGVYFIRLNAYGLILTRKITLQK